MSIINKKYYTQKFIKRANLLLNVLIFLKNDLLYCSPTALCFRGMCKIHMGTDL